MTHRDLLVKALKSLDDASDARANELENRLYGTTQWQSLLYTYDTHVADLEGTIRATRTEFIILGAVGLFRPAMQSLRSFFELSLAWTYYVDHPREWESCKIDHGFFKTPKQLRESMFDCHHYLEENFQLMQDHAKRDRNPYSALSKFAHAADPDMVTDVVQAGDMVRGQNEYNILRNRTKDVDGYLFDWYASIYCPTRWVSLSSELRSAAAERLSGDRVPAGAFEAFRNGQDLRSYLAKSR